MLGNFNWRFGVRCASAKIVIQLLTVGQKKYCLPVTSDLFQSAETDENFFKSLVTGDETWVYSYDHILNNSHYTGKHLHHHNTRKCTKSSTRWKWSILLFPIKKVFCTVSIFHKDKQTIFYLELIRCLHDAVCCKQNPRKWLSAAWQMYRDNVLAHLAQLVWHVLAKHHIQQVHQPLYFQDMAPCDFSLFPHIKNTLKGKCYEDMEML